MCQLKRQCGARNGFQQKRIASDSDDMWMYSDLSVFEPFLYRAKSRTRPRRHRGVDQECRILCAVFITA